MATGMVRIGISGWRYPPWRGVFYPPKLPQRQELAFASRRLPSIEINGSFYALQRPSSYEAWHDATPDDFVFSVKGPKEITHTRRLKDVGTPLANFFASGVLALRDKLGPVLWQLPPQLAFDAAQVDAFFAMLPHDTDAARALAREHDGRQVPDARLASTHAAPGRARRDVFCYFDNTAEGHAPGDAARLAARLDLPTGLSSAAPAPAPAS
jgi:uncharacterized protein YecE (DUF72 family)